MDLQDLLTTRRTGQPVDKIKHDRTEFQRDYDRMIFSPAFRRLQNKTQVFPLPNANVFVHNRLTHSLEVASVGRSLGNNLSAKLASEGILKSDYIYEIGSIVAAACLAHDLGNPPFGHSGEKAIQHYFAYGNGVKYVKQAKEKNALTDAQESDLINFDGNANTFRLLTHKFNGRREGGYALTFPTVASIIKYPRNAVGVKKFGYFASDEPMFDAIREQFGLREVAPGQYQRYPLVYLVEAADDICYQIMDVEDATRLGILSFDQTRELLCSFFDKTEDAWFFENLENVFAQVSDTHERISYLRAMVVGKLVNCSTEVFWQNREAIFAGEFKKGLAEHLPEPQRSALQRVASFAIKNIYANQRVVDIEISGLEIIRTLLDRFMYALCSDEGDYYGRLMQAYIPQQFMVDKEAGMYERMMAAVDIVSGMTDVYALDLYKKIGGQL